MSLPTILLSIALIIVLGAAVYLFMDRNNWMQEAKDCACTTKDWCEQYTELKNLFDALDDENAQLTVKCYQYETLLGERLDNAVSEPETDIMCYPSCRGDQCYTCEIGDCASRLERKTVLKPCCSCWNGVYNVPACEGCDSVNNYENYTPMNY